MTPENVNIESYCGKRLVMTVVVLCLKKQNCDKLFFIKFNLNIFLEMLAASKRRILKKRISYKTDETTLSNRKSPGREKFCAVGTDREKIFSKKEKEKKKKRVKSGRTR
jgi:hypothetical protein